MSLALPKDIHALSGIRLFAAFWVVIFHFNAVFKKLLPFYDSVESFALKGYLAVPMFFMLSGFILSHNYFSTYEIRNHLAFVSRRFVRLWPVHLITILFFLMYVGVEKILTGKIGSYFPISVLPSELALVRCWFSDEVLWNWPAWAIHVLWFSYLFLFPAAFLCFRNATRISNLIITIILFLILHCFFPLNIPGRCDQIVFLFLTGSALYKLRVLCPRIEGHWAANLGILLLVVGLCGDSNYSLFVIHVAFALIIFGLSFEKGILVNLLSHKWVIYGGAISYTLYMTHVLVLKFYSEIDKLLFKNQLLNFPLSFFLFLMLVAVLLITAIAFYHFIEIPCSRMLRTKISGIHLFKKLG